MTLMRTKLATVSVIAAVTLMIVTTIASMAPSSAMAIRIVGGESNAANNVAQAGLVNANVGANALNNAAVCVNVLGTC